MPESQINLHEIRPVCVDAWGSLFTMPRSSLMGQLE